MHLNKHSENSQTIFLGFCFRHVVIQFGIVVHYMELERKKEIFKRFKEI